MATSSEGGWLRLQRLSSNNWCAVRSLPGGAQAGGLASDSLPRVTKLRCCLMLYRYPEFEALVDKILA